MSFTDVMGIGALAGIAMIVLGALLLAFLPRWRGFTLQGTEGEEEGSAVRVLFEALAKALAGFLTVVLDIVKGEAGKYHPGQVLVSIGFLLFLICAIVWLAATVT